MAFDRKVLAAVMATVAASGVQAVDYRDLTGVTPSSTLVNGAWIFPNSGIPYVSGSGTFNAFLSIQGNPSEEGFNVGAGGGGGSKPAMSDVGSGESLQPNALTRPTPGPVGSLSADWFTFSLDINEQAGGGNEFISLDQIKIYGADRVLELDPAYPDAGNSTDAAKLAYLQNNSTLMWDMDGLGDVTVLLDYLTVSSGSGAADVLLAIPDSSFLATVPVKVNGVVDNNQQVANYYIYFYTEMGAAGLVGSRNFRSDAGFEEWNTVSGLTLIPPPIVPEASTWFAGVSLTALVGGMWYRRRKTA